MSASAEQARIEQARLDAIHRSLLEPGDALDAAAVGPHMASNGRGGRREVVDLTWLSGPKVFDFVVKRLLVARARAKHVGGSDGSIARTLPADLPMSHLLLSRRWFSIYDLGMASDLDPVLEFRCEREEVASVTVLRERHSGWMRVTRITFRDGSFADYSLLRHEGNDAFWA